LGSEFTATKKNIAKKPEQEKEAWITNIEHGILNDEGKDRK
jgi:hypothetical protein